MLKFKKAEKDDIANLMRLDKQLRLDLKSKGHLDFIQPLKRQELEKGLEEPSTIIMVNDSKGLLLGFVFLKEMTDGEESIFEKAFENFKPGKVLLIREVGFYPAYRKAGNCMQLLQEAKKYACENGFEQFAGSLHPEDLQSQNAILSLWTRGSALHFDNQCIEVREKVRYLRQKFLLDLV